jgi:hypothetical protein
MQLTLLWYKTLFPFCLYCYRHVGGSFRTAVRITQAVGGWSFAAKASPCKITLRRRRLFVHVWGSYSSRFYRDSPAKFSLWRRMSRLFPRNERMIFLTICEIFWLSHMVENVCRGRRAINLALTGGNRRRRRRCVDSDYRVWTETVKIRIAHLKRIRKWSECLSVECLSVLIIVIILFFICTL